jgi:hypothetical protein
MEPLSFTDPENFTHPDPGDTPALHEGRGGGVRAEEKGAVGKSVLKSAVSLNDCAEPPRKIVEALGADQRGLELPGPTLA